MTITVNSNCTSILVNSDNFNGNNISNSLSLIINGGTAVVLVPLSNATSYTITPASLDLDVFVEGVYQIELSSVLSDSSVVEDRGCTAVICALKCSESTLLLYKDPINIMKVLALEGLQAATDCVTCSCSLMTDFYNIIKDDESTCSCGCCQS